MAAKKADGKPANAGKKASPKPAKVATAAASKPKHTAQPTQAEAATKSAEVRKKGAPVREM